MAHDGPMFCQLTKFPDMSSLQTKQQKQMSPWTFLRVPWTIPDIHRYKWRWNSCHCKWYTNFHSCYITEIESIFNLFLDIFFVTMRGSIFHETGVCLIYKDAWYLNNLRRFLSSTPISWNGSSSKSGTCVALRWNSTGGPLVCNQTARGPAQWETQPFETNCWLASDVSFFHHQTFLGGKAFGYKEMWTKGHESLIISEKTHLDTGSWTSHFIVLVPYFRWRSFGIKSVMEAIHKLKKTTYTKCRQNSSGTGLVGGGRGAGHLWIATQAPGAILWWFWGKPASRRVGWTLHIQKVASLGRWIF